MNILGEYCGEEHPLLWKRGLAELRLKDAELDEVGVEALLNFAEKFLLNAAWLWMKISLEQRQRFQKVLFPEGIELTPHRGIRTAVT